MTDHQQNAYAVYHEWKSWTADSFGAGSPELHNAYRALVRAQVDTSSGSAIDFGFGNGEMLATLRDLGFQATGIERNPFLREVAAQKGFAVADSLTADTLPKAGTTALITALHVLEHLDKDTLRNTLARFAELLQPGGVVIAAFPNGDSPFSAPAFNGDITHVTWIGSSMAEQLGGLCGMQLTRYIAFPSLTCHSPRLAVRAKGFIRSTMESLVSGTLSRVYYGGASKVLSPVAVAVWTKVPRA